MELKCKKFSGKIIKKYSGTATQYLDQLDDNIVWVNRLFMKRYLKSKYRITEKEYFNIVVYGDRDIRLKCRCGRDLKYYRLNAGYYRSCARKECISGSHSIANHIRWKNLKGKEREEFSNKLGFSSKESGTHLVRYAAYKRFLNQGDPNDICFLYLAKTKNGKLKFGVSKDPDYRQKRMGFKKYIIIRKGSREYISRLEFNIKIEMNTCSEYFDWSDLPKYRNAFNKVILTI